MDNADVILKRLEIEVLQVENQFRTCFERVFRLNFENSLLGLEGVALKILNHALNSSEFRVDDEGSRLAIAAAATLESKAGKSLTKRNLLYQLAMGQICARNVRTLAEEGSIAAAIDALCAAAAASGAIQASAHEADAKAAPGRRSSGIRTKRHETLSNEALQLWRATVDPKISAARAAEMLRQRGVGISHDKLVRLISAEKRASARKAEQAIAELAAVLPLRSVR